MSTPCKVLWNDDSLEIRNSSTKFNVVLVGKNDLNYEHPVIEGRSLSTFTTRTVNLDLTQFSCFWRRAYVYS
jgi:hypothetical protein